MDTRTRSVVGPLAVVALTGLGLGVVVGGIIGRLAMFGLARLNPEQTGVLSDDGFVIGRFTLDGTLNLIGAAGGLGLVGAGIYVLVRPLVFGPPWFRVTSVALGAGLPVGSQIVQTDGVDFTLLTPAWLGIAMFVLIPALYGALLYLVVERVLAGRPVVRSHPAPSVSWPLWVLRALATAVFVAFFVDLVRDTVALT